MIRIEKNKFMQRFLVSFALIALVFLTSLGYFLGWEFQIEKFLIYLFIVVGECLLFWLIYFILRKTNKKYYLVDDKKIRQFKNNEEIESFEISKATEIFYTRVIWLLFMQFGSGYLHFKYEATEKKDNNYSPTIRNNRLYSISMSLKDAKKIKEIILRRIIIK